MRSLEEIKDDYVRDKFLASYELDTWVGFQNYFASRHPEWFEQHWEDITERYAEEYAKESLRLASDSVNVKVIGAGYIVIDKQSILSESNLPKH